jgi:hypothetical protein
MISWLKQQGGNSRSRTGSPRSRERAKGAPGLDVSIRSLWATLIGAKDLEDVLSWPPDVLALVDRTLELSEAYRFLVSPPRGVDFAHKHAIISAEASARDWLKWMGELDTSPPASLNRWWSVVRESLDVTIGELSAGSNWDTIEALLILHAIADEACAGLGTASAVRPGAGCLFRSFARELMTETGSLSTFSPGILRVLPRGRTPTSGMSISSLSRHVCVRGPQVDVEWHRMLSRPTGVERPSAHANVVLLPWPLRVRARDFRPVPYPLANMDSTEFGFFEFRPDDTLDLDLVDKVLRAAKDEAGNVDIVVLPEAAISPSEVEPLEKLLGEHGVWCLITGVRESPSDGWLGSNRVHVGARQEVVWRHASQNKHHRWCLDTRQIGQYHLGGSLTPTMRWWEAISIPRRSLQVIDMGAITFIPLLCEDLARLEPVADLIRSIGPTLVLTLLLDGPQLASRWTARYAGVLADDPGSAVWTFTSYGMAQRCRPPGCRPSRVIALWRDPSGAQTEIELEEGADAVLVTTNVTHGTSITADGRRHFGTTSDLTLVAARSLYAGDAPPGPGVTGLVENPDGDHLATLPDLDEKDLSKLTSWLEAVAEAVVIDPFTVDRVITEATQSEWRLRLGLPGPSPLLVDAIFVLEREVSGSCALDDLIAAADRLHGSKDPTAMLVGMLLRTSIEERLVTEVRTGRMGIEILDLVTSHSS